MTERDFSTEQGGLVFSDILKRANVGLLLYNQNGDVLYANEFMELLTGYKPAEIIRAGFFELVTSDPAELENYKKKLNTTAREPPYDFDVSIVRKTGERIDLNITTSLFEHAPEPYLLLILQNITNRKAFERVIVSSFDKFIQTTIELDAALKKIREQSKILGEYKEKIQQELLIASSVQRAIIPQVFPSNDMVDIWGISIPCSELGGDYLDIFQMDRNRLGILLADVAGHGVHAALISAMAKVYFVNYSRLYNDPAHVLARVNADLEKIFRGTGFYLSAVYSVLDLDTMSLRTATAGHENPLYMSGSTGEKLGRLGNLEGGAILGSIPPSFVHYISDSNQLEEGSTIVYYTDGIPEARNAREEFYGDDRLHAYIRTHHYLPAREFCEKLIKETDTWYGGIEPNDDRTVIVLKILKSPAGVAAPGGKDRIRDYFNAGQSLFDRGKYEEAIVEFTRILEIDPESFRAHHFVGRAALSLRRFPDAEASFRSVIELNPEYYQGYYQLGIALYNQARYDQAHRVWSTLKGKAGEYKRLDEYLKMVGEKVGK